jgi:glucosamine--fructose-6-phosphate aminotransferase (isomerizing)
MSASALLSDIRGQADSIRGVIERHFAGGLERPADALRSARHVILTGMGSSLYACFPAAHLLIEKGIQASVVDAAELLYYQMGLCGPGCTVVMVSRSGETIEVVKLLRAIQASGARTVGVTNEPDSTLAREPELSIVVGSQKDQLVAIQSYTGTVATLAMVAFTAGGSSASETRDLTAPLAQAVHDTVVPLVETMPLSGIETARAVYLLGRGSSLGSVREGALLFNEAARTPSVALTAAEFRHGPVEVVDDGFFGFVFASQPATAALDRRLAADISAGGGRAVIASDLARCDGVHPVFAPVLEIIPVQIAALRLAQAKGISPGNFRFAPLVTSTEAGFETPARTDRRGG